MKMTKQAFKFLLYFISFYFLSNKDNIISKKKFNLIIHSYVAKLYKTLSLLIILFHH